MHFYNRKRRTSILCRVNKKEKMALKYHPIDRLKKEANLKSYQQNLDLFHY